MEHIWNKYGTNMISVEVYGTNMIGGTEKNMEQIWNKYRTNNDQRRKLWNKHDWWNENKNMEQIWNKYEANIDQIWSV